MEFSGGESQKLAISRLIYKNSPVEILDEPTSALDPISENEIFLKFNRISNNDLLSNKMRVYISHRLSSCQFSDKIAVFKNGQIVQYGSHKELVELKGSLYYQMWNAQAKYYN